MQRHVRTSAWLLAVLLLSAVSAWAQVQTGVLSVKVVDAQGAVLPGATVTVTSPVLPSPLVGVTDSSGVYQVPGLTAATYSVKVTLQGFQTFVREGLILHQSETVSVDVGMKVGTMSEEVTVKGESPLVDTKSVGSKTDIDATILDTTPGGKDIWNILEYKAPGVVVETPDVGGNQGGLQRAMSARGVPNAQNTQLLNGVNVNDPAAQGYSMNYYIPSAFQNIQVSTGAEDISVGTGGVFINMVTKSGTNQLSGEALQTYQGKPTQSNNVDSTLLNDGFRPDSNSTQILSNSNVQVGGPVLKNRLFYFGSFNFQATHVKVPGFPAVAPSYIATPLSATSDEDTTDILAGEGKLTYQLGQKDRFEGYLSRQRYDKPNRASSVGNTQESDWKELDTFVVTQLAYNRVLSNQMFLDAKVAYNNTHFPLYQKTDLQPIFDNSTGIQYRNNTSNPLMFRRRTEAIANWQFYVPDMLFGRHEFKAGFDNGYTPETVTTTRADNVNLVFTSLPTPSASTVQIFNTPLVQQRSVMTTALYGQDSYSIKRLTVVGGIRWERVEGYLPSQTDQDSQYFPGGTVFTAQNYTVQKQFDPIHGDPLWHNWAPRFAATYDLFGNGKTALKASWGKYLDQIGTGTPPNPNANLNQTYAWNDLNGDFIFEPGSAVWNGAQYVGGEFGSLTRTANLNVAVFNKDIQRPYTNELDVSVDHQLLPNTSVEAAFIHTRQHQTMGTADANEALWPTLYSQVALTDPGRDGILGTADDQPITVYSLNPGAVTNSVTINDDRLAQHYNGVDLNVTQRSSKFNLIFGYTYSHTRQDVLSVSNPNSIFVFANGEAGGRRHNLKATGSYQMKYGILLSGNFRLQSGLPITRTWAIQACSSKVTVDCLPSSTTVDTEPRGSVELPWLPTLDLRAGRNFNLNSNEFELSVDVYNVTNANTVYNVRLGSNTTPIQVAGNPTAPVMQIATFLSPTQFLAPRVVRLNVTYRFGRQ
ncbi:MAG: carboxypeptidase regulatory-like domain-containing protein [Vicinamibacterales bacterium]